MVQLFMKTDEYFMKEAIKRAKKAYMLNEPPIGAVIVMDGEIISSGYNKREIKKNALCHAEIEAINKACKKVGGWRLVGCSLYVSLEPCVMCAGAIINSRIDKVVFGAYDKRFGAMGSVCDISKMPFNHSPQVVGGVLENESVQLLKRFFSEIREIKKNKKIFEE